MRWSPLSSFRTFSSPQISTVYSSNNHSTSPLPCPLLTTDLLSLWICLFWIHPKRGIIDYMAFCVWLLSLSVMCLRFVQDAACISTLFLFMADYIILFYYYSTSIPTLTPEDACVIECSCPKTFLQFSENSSGCPTVYFNSGSGVSNRSHGFRAQTHKTAYTSDTSRKYQVPGLPPCLSNLAPKSGGVQSCLSSVKFANFLEWLTELRKEFIYTVACVLRYLTLCDPIDHSPQTPLSMDFSDKNTGVGWHFLLQGIFPTQGSNPHLLPGQADSLSLVHLGNNVTIIYCYWLTIKDATQR